MGVKPRRLELFCTRKSLAMVDMLIIQHWTFFPLSGAKCFHNFFFLLPSHSLAKEQKSCVDNGKCSTQLNLRIREYSSHPGNEALFRRLRGFSSTPTAPPPPPLQKDVESGSTLQRRVPTTLSIISQRITFSHLYEFMPQFSYNITINLISLYCGYVLS